MENFDNSLNLFWGVNFRPVDLTFEGPERTLTISPDSLDVYDLDPLNNPYIEFTGFNFELEDLFFDGQT